MNKVIYIIIYIFSIIIASYAQILLKKGAANKKNIYVNKHTIIGYLLMIVSTFFSLIGYRGVSMSLSQVLQVLGFFFVAIFSYLMLNEKITKRIKIGLIIVVIGILISAIWCEVEYEKIKKNFVW